MKYREISQGRKRRNTSVQPPLEPPKVKKQKLSVIEAARQRREAEDEAVSKGNQDEPVSLQNIAQNMGVESLQKLAIVEEMEVPVRERQTPIESDSNRWDKRWNGRKNYKKFRRKGDGNGLQYRTQPVIVPLEEFNKKDFGTSNIYYAGGRGGSQSQRTTEPAGEITATSQTPVPARSPTPQFRATKHRRDSDSDDGLKFRFRRRRER